MVLQFYIDPLSQPSRAVTMFLRLNKIEYEEKIVQVLTGEIKTPEYAKINRFQMVPALVHDDFHLSESTAIMLYLIQTNPVADHWYPKDPKVQARVNEFLSWQHTSLRIILIRYMVALLQPPAVTEKAFGQHRINTEDIADCKMRAEKALDVVENIWLKDSKFISGEQITIADLLAVEEIEQLRLIKYDFRAGRPKIAAYVNRVKQFIGAELYDEIHQLLDAGL